MSSQDLMHDRQELRVLGERCWIGREFGGGADCQIWLCWFDGQQREEMDVANSS